MCPLVVIKHREPLKEHVKIQLLLVQCYNVVSTCISIAVEIMTSLVQVMTNVCKQEALLLLDHACCKAVVWRAFH